jgi:hypothetical protein
MAAFVKQASGDADAAGTQSWMLITKRDRRETMVSMPTSIFERIWEGPGKSIPKLTCNVGDIGITCLRLSDFLRGSSRNLIESTLHHLKND